MKLASTLSLTWAESKEALFPPSPSQTHHSVNLTPNSWDTDVVYLAYQPLTFKWQTCRNNWYVSRNKQINTISESCWMTHTWQSAQLHAVLTAFCLMTWWNSSSHSSSWMQKFQFSCLNSECKCLSSLFGIYHDCHLEYNLQINSQWYICYYSLFAGCCVGGIGDCSLNQAQHWLSSSGWSLFGFKHCKHCWIYEMPKRCVNRYLHTSIRKIPLSRFIYFIYVVWMLILSSNDRNIKD